VDQKSGSVDLKKKLEHLQQTGSETSGTDHGITPKSSKCGADSKVLSDGFKEDAELDPVSEYVHNIEQGQTTVVESRTDKTLEEKLLEDYEFNDNITDVEADSDYEENNLILLLRSTEFREKCKEKVCTHRIIPDTTVVDHQSSSLHDSKPVNEDPEQHGGIKPYATLTSQIVEQESTLCLTPTTKFLYLESSSCHDSDYVTEDQEEDPEPAGDIEPEATKTGLLGKHANTDCLSPTRKIVEQETKSSHQDSKFDTEDSKPETETEPKRMMTRINVVKDGTHADKAKENNYEKPSELSRATPFLTGRNPCGDFFTVDLEERPN
jgi:hypothetical protein